MPTRALALCVALASLAGGCSREPSVEEQRRELLKPKDRKQDLKERLEKARLYDGEGNLIASGEEILGIPLPRGLSLTRHFENEWYYETQVRYEPLARWFKSHLFTGRIDQYETGALRFVKAVSVTRPKSPRADVWVSPVPNRGGVSYVRIRQPGKIRPEIPSEAQVKAQMEARRKFSE